MDLGFEPRQPNFKAPPQLLFYAPNCIIASYDNLHDFRGIRSTMGIRKGFPDVGTTCLKHQELSR